MQKSFDWNLLMLLVCCLLNPLDKNCELFSTVMQFFFYTTSLFVSQLHRWGTRRLFTWFFFVSSHFTICFFAVCTYSLCYSYFWTCLVPFALKTPWMCRSDTLTLLSMFALYFIVSSFFYNYDLKIFFFCTSQMLFCDI